MRTLQKQVSVLAVLAVVALLSTHGAAQCGAEMQFTPKLESEAWHGGGGSAYLLNIADGQDQNSIVGMWRFSFISQGNNAPPLSIPDGAVLDHGFAQWHPDGTEITNSNRLPSTGNFCLGVWKRVGPNHYQLNHFAMGFDDGIHPSYSNIREDVTLSEDGKSFSGTFSIAIYDLEGHAGPVINGQLVGTRVTLDTTVQDIL
jgi:hypothetical protein